MILPLHKRADDGLWISWLGSPTQFLVISDETGGSYCLSRAHSAPGGGAPAHSHAFEEGFYILKGSLQFTVGAAEHHLSAGDFLNVGSNVPHSIQNLSGQEAEYLIFCAPSGFDQFQREGGYPMESRHSPTVPLTPEVKARMLEAAARYGINLHPDPANISGGRTHVVRQSEGVTIDTVGDRYRFLCRSAESEGRYSLWDATIYPGGGPPPHIHTREEEGFFILEGKLNFHTDSTSFEATAGEFVHLPRNGLHWFKNQSEEPAKVLILVAPGGFEAMFLETGTLRSGPHDSLAPADPEEKRKILEAAPKYGVTIKV